MGIPWGLEPGAVAPLLQTSISLATLCSRGSGQRYRKTLKPTLMLTALTKSLSTVGTTPLSSALIWLTIRWLGTVNLHRLARCSGHVAAMVLLWPQVMVMMDAMVMGVSAMAGCVDSCVPHGKQVPLQRGAKPGYLKNARVGEDGDALQKVD